MDKGEAIILSKKYLEKIKSSPMNLLEAWLFGSFAKGNQHADSDIDLAVVLKENGKHSFETEVKLMNIRMGDELIIEPHAFTIDEFNDNDAIVHQIRTFGERIEI